MHVHAAVDDDRLAGHEVAVVGGEEDHRADQVLGILIALEGAAFSSVRQLFRVGDAFLIRTRYCQAGHDRIHTNVVAADFPRQGAGEAQDAAFGRYVVQEKRRAGLGRARRDVDDLALLLLLHRGIDCFDAEKKSFDVDRHHPVPFVGVPKDAEPTIVRES